MIMYRDVSKMTLIKFLSLYFLFYVIILVFLPSSAPVSTSTLVELRLLYSQLIQPSAVKPTKIFNFRFSNLVSFHKTIPQEPPGTIHIGRIASDCVFYFSEAMHVRLAIV